MQKARPDWGLEMEESGITAGADPDAPTWIVDPLDGTTNFLHGIPHFAISIAVRDKGKITGLVFDPFAMNIFCRSGSGAYASGAYANDRRIRVQAAVSDRAVFATGIPFVGRGTAKTMNVFARTAKYYGCQCWCATVWIGTGLLMWQLDVSTDFGCTG